MDKLSREQLRQILETLKRDKERKIEEERLLDVDVPEEKNDETMGDDDVFEDQTIPGKRRSTIFIDDFLTRLKPIRKRYTSSFTMHALDHIINGTMVVRVFWTAKLFLVIGTAVFMSRQLFYSYFLNHVDTKLVFSPQVRDGCFTQYI